MFSAPEPNENTVIAQKLANIRSLLEVCLDLATQDQLKNHFDFAKHILSGLLLDLDNTVVKMVPPDEATADPTPYMPAPTATAHLGGC